MQNNPEFGIGPLTQPEKVFFSQVLTKSDLKPTSDQASVLNAGMKKTPTQIVGPGTAKAAATVNKPSQVWIHTVNQFTKQALNWIEMDRVATPPVSVSSSEVVFAIKLVLWLLQLVSLVFPLPDFPFLVFLS